MAYTTPGVFVEEVAVLPPSVAQVATAIPAFIGYTEKALNKSGDEREGLVIERINNMKEYTELFGAARETLFEVTLNEGRIECQPKKTDGDNDFDLGILPEYFMYYSLKMFFSNGGGACYIVSVGRYDDGPANKEHFEMAIDEIRKYDEPTLLVCVDAVHLENDYFVLCTKILSQCGDLKDRFGIFDVLNGDKEASEFRNGIGTNQLKYGAAYTPYLRTSLMYDYNEQDVSINGIKSHETHANGLLIMHQGETDEGNPPKLSITSEGDKLSFSVDEDTLVIKGITGDKAKPSAIILGWGSFPPEKRKGFELFVNGDGSENVTPNEDEIDLGAEVNLTDLQNTLTQTYNQIKKELSNQRIVLPPSSAIAGIYSRVDRTRGVWKSPANESLNNVLEPLIKFDNDQQGLLNVHPNGGKSINVIRSFSGKGTLVWGGRTLAGNDNEWRYINVRRLFIMIEESIQKSTSWVVFESNNAITWLKVKALIESFLYGLWQQGGLMGNTPQQAYYVNVGLGKTMTPQDVLEGRLIVEVGVAAVRPAEFIILKFYHKLPEA